MESLYPKQQKSPLLKIAASALAIIVAAAVIFGAIFWLDASKTKAYLKKHVVDKFQLTAIWSALLMDDNTLHIVPTTQGPYGASVESFSGMVIYPSGQIRTQRFVSGRCNDQTSYTAPIWCAKKNVTGFPKLGEKLPVPYIADPVVTVPIPANQSKAASVKLGSWSITDGGNEVTFKSDISGSVPIKFSSLVYGTTLLLDDPSLSVVCAGDMSQVVALDPQGVNMPQTSRVFKEKDIMSFMEDAPAVPMTSTFVWMDTSGGDLLFAPAGNTYNTNKADIANGFRLLSSGGLASYGFFNATSTTCDIVKSARSVCQQATLSAVDA